MLFREESERAREKERGGRGRGAERQIVKRD